MSNKSGYAPLWKFTVNVNFQVASKHQPSKQKSRYILDAAPPRATGVGRNLGRLPIQQVHAYAVLQRCGLPLQRSSHATSAG